MPLSTSVCEPADNRWRADTTEASSGQDPGDLNGSDGLVVVRPKQSERA
jgi:hypothetical protein